MTLRLFGLTGGIASGKSTVARRFAERGVPVIDADALARDVVAPGTEGLNAVLEAFGSRFQLASGELDRRALGAFIFSSHEARASLNALLHPRIRIAAQRAAEQLANRGELLACYEAALLLETQLNDDIMRPLVVVAAPEGLQIARLQQRNGMSENEARLRLAAQLPLAEKIRAADIVVPNEQTLAVLCQHADNALDDVLRRVNLPVARYPRPVDFVLVS